MVAINICFMLPELAAEVSVFIIFLAIIGYLVFTFYDLGYYGAWIYRPSKNRGGIESFFGNAAKGFLLLFFLMFIISYLIVSRFITIPDYLNDIPITPEVYGYMAIASFAFFVVNVALLIAMIIAAFFGKFQFFTPGTKVIIEKNDLGISNKLKVREIYDEDENFYYYIDFNQNWGTVRKTEVKSMRSEETTPEERQLKMTETTQPFANIVNRGKKWWNNRKRNK